MRNLLLLVIFALVVPQLSAIDCSKLRWKCQDNTAKIVEEDGRKIAVIEVPPNMGGMHYVTAPLDMKELVGKEVVMSIKARWTNVTKPSRPWLGLKFMLSHARADNEHDYLSPNGYVGTQDWTEIFMKFDSVEEGAHNGVFSLGLQESSGKVEFDLSSLKLEIRPLPPIPNTDYKVSYSERVAKTPPLRGVMSPGRFMVEDDFKTLKEWNVNLIRFQMKRRRGNTIATDDKDLVAYDKWLAEWLDNLEQVLNWAPKYGIKVVVDLHSAPGGRLERNEMRMFREKEYFDHFVEVWKMIATRFKGNPSIWAYDLINEPSQSLDVPFDYWTVQKTAAEAVRAIDPDTPIMIESNKMDQPQTFKRLPALAMDNVIYQVHIYNPGTYTHQGIRVPGTRSYPGVIDGLEWNKERLRKVLQPVLNFQKQHNARIFVGEFSVAIWAPGAERYLTDCIELFEEYGWDWTYHAFREAKCWDLESEGENMKSFRPSADNPRKQVVLEAFKKNKQ